MSKTRLFQSIKSLDVDAVSALLGSHPELARVKDERRRNALHVLCGLPYRDDTSHRSLGLARLLLDRGFDVNEPAFVEGGGAFKATPLWYSLSRGRNLPLARLLLRRGSTPEYCLWTSGFHDDVEAIDLLVKSGASLDPVAEDETPFLGAIKWSRFKAAERLLHHGADVNFQNSKGMTALHALVRKKSDRRHVELLLRHGADPTRRDAKGVSPLDLVARRRDKTLFNLFSERTRNAREEGHP
jgi:ankyrin repeat protein